MEDPLNVNRIPQWISNLAAMVRPGGVALMFLLITLFPIMFAFIEIAFKNTGVRIAATIAGYFQAIPEIFYTTLQVMFAVYVAGKSSEIVSGNIGRRQPSPVAQTESGDIDVNVTQGEGRRNAGSES